MHMTVTVSLPLQLRRSGMHSREYQIAKKKREKKNITKLPFSLLFLIHSRRFYICSCTNVPINMTRSLSNSCLENWVNCLQVEWVNEREKKASLVNVNINSNQYEYLPAFLFPFSYMILAHKSDTYSQFV